MPQLAGTTIVGRYRIERELGVGGMATVYLALDVRHDRRVAVKVLRPELSAIVGADRFLNEIRTTANLQHPHILPLHDSGEADGIVFYVMPLVEGESLRERLTREKQLPIDDAVRIAHDVAEALDYAHRHGVIHRDIKPENILLHDGRALVADFGIALAVSTAGGATRMTETGMSLGTPHYMSPEQAMGEREITARSDVYALGSVLYEMLAGEPPFTGPTAQAILAKVVTSDPADLMTLRRTVPPHVAAAVHTALQRLPADRFASARDFADTLTGKTAARMPTQRVVLQARSPSWQSLLPWGLAAVAIMLAAAGWYRRPPEPRAAPITRFVVAEGNLGTPIGGTNLTLSRDGTQLLYRRRSGNRELVVIRDLARLEERELSVTGSNHRFSPEGGSLVFVGGGPLGSGIRTVRLSGGAPAVISASGNRPMWGESGRIVFENERGLWIAEPNGTPPERLTSPDGAVGESRHAWADFLPGDKAIVFSIEDSSQTAERNGRSRSAGSAMNDDQLAVVTLDDRRVKRLGITGTSPHYIGGFLLFGRSDGTAHAVRFDLDRLEPVGPEIQVIDRVVVRGGGAVELAVANGTVAYIEGTNTDRLVLVDNSGRSQPLIEKAGIYVRPRPSPDGMRVAVAAREPTETSTDIWLIDVASGSTRRLTNVGRSVQPSWVGNQESIVWQHTDTTGVEIRQQALDGRGVTRTIWSGGRDAELFGITADPSGRWILATFRDQSGPFSSDIHLARLDSTPLVFRPLIATQTTEIAPAVSPDGQRLSYVSNESGLGEVYVTSFPVPTRALRISTGGGVDPVWSPDGRSIYYRSTGKMVVARFNAAFTAFTTDSLFALDGYPRPILGPPTASFAMMPDGKLLMTQTDPSRRLVTVVSFHEELRQRFAELERSK